MAKQKPCRECKHYEKCCYYGGWTDAQWHRYYRINEGRGDCWEGEEVEYIRNAPIVDAKPVAYCEPVVYCKDCFYSEELSKYIKEQYGSNVVHCTHPHWGGKLMKDYGFCCFGERNENNDIPICLTEDCPYQKGSPCEAWETCGGFEGKENN